MSGTGPDENGSLWQQVVFGRMGGGARSGRGACRGVRGGGGVVVGGIICLKPLIKSYELNKIIVRGKEVIVCRLLQLS